MKNYNKYKTYSLIALLIFCASALFLFRNFLGITGLANQTIGFFLSFIFLVTSVYYLFFLSLKLTGIINEISTDTESKSKSVPTENDIIVNSANEINKPSEVSFIEISDAIRGEFNLKKFGEQLLIEVSKRVELVQGIIYCRNPRNNKYEMVASFALDDDTIVEEFEEGEGFPGQVAKSKKVIEVTDFSDHSRKIISGLGEAIPTQLVFFPVIINDDCISIIELAFFKSISQSEIDRINELSSKIAFHLNRRIDDSFKS